MRQITHNNVDDFQNNYTEQKKPDEEEYMPCASIYIKL